MPIQTCPACRGAMLEEDFASARVDVCQACGGIWFDRGELVRLRHPSSGAGPALRRALTMPVRPRVHEGERTCVACAEPMQRTPYGPEPAVHVDRCARCEGLFLEAGELTAVREHRRSLGAGWSAAREARERQESRERHGGVGAVTAVDYLLHALTALL